MNETYPFQLIPLPYSYNSLEPYIDEETLHYHHDKHLKTYVDNLNKALQQYPEYHNLNLPTLLVNYTQLPKEIQTAVYNNGGGVFNHNLYFATMRPPKQDNIPSGELSKAILNCFNTYAEFKELLTNTAVAQFGSGYGWLICSKDGKLSVIGLPNQSTPLDKGFLPLLPVDVWEHAYYLKYKNLRKDYVENWFNLINWPVVEKLYSTRDSFFN